MKVDHVLVIVLLERWRQETQTFYLLVDETIIMLQDVDVPLDLQIDNPVVTSHPAYDCDSCCELLDYCTMPVNLTELD